MKVLEILKSLQSWQEQTYIWLGPLTLILIDEFYFTTVVSPSVNFNKIIISIARMAVPV